MDRGEKKGVRQGRPARRASASILLEADRIIKERLREIEGKNGRSPLLLCFLFGMAVGAALCIVIPLALHAV